MRRGWITRANGGFSGASCCRYRLPRSPLIVLSRSENFTLQLALNAFQGELTTQWNYLLAMTVITLLPVTAVFAFLQKHITTGIAAAGVK